MSSDHNYVSHCSTSGHRINIGLGCENSEIPAPFSQEVPLWDLYNEVKQKVDFFLPRRWNSSVDNNVFRLVYFSAQQNVTVQRTLEFFPNGATHFYVHCNELSIDPYLEGTMPPLPLQSDTINYFVDRLVTVMNNVRKVEVCSGYDEEKYRVAWSSCAYGEVDKNPYRECRYNETFRSLNCLRVVSSRKWRCVECSKLSRPLRRRTLAAQKENCHPCTNNRFLTEEQKLKKLMDQRHELDNAKKKIARLHTKMQVMIKRESIQVEQNMSDAFGEILRDSDCVSPAQSIFLQQQVKASQQKNSCAMKWHPTMIRLALAIHLTSPTAYNLMRDTGMVKLPAVRTLFDYSHVNRVKEGIDKVVIEEMGEKVKKMCDELHPTTKNKCTFKKYHVLMADEMSISQNLVFQKSTGKLVGFTSLDDLDREVRVLESHLDNPEKELEETIGTKIMVYMAKGVSNGVKEVVATFATDKLSANQMKVWTWKVIGALERSGLPVIAFVCDGSSVNRAFIKKNKPATPHPSGVTFDTWNKCARNRKLFFISDVPHLLKTIRNCMLNSRWDKLKSRRRMVKNQQRITWDFIIKLYDLKVGKNLRKSYKLNAMNVYPDSYARMKVKTAAEPLSGTVCKDIRSQGWPDASETALFIEKVNNWFDCLNGAHTSVAKKKRNSNLESYTSVEDSRFRLLEEFLEYLDEWQEEAEAPNMSCVSNNDPNQSGSGGPADCDQSDIEGEDSPEDVTPARRRQLSRETLEGIRMTTLAFKPLVTFLLEEGTVFINARVFTQDPLEQHFSKIRAGHGGSNNPNLLQCLNKIRALHTFGELGIRKRKGNSGEDGSTVEVTTEPLPKRKCSRTPKFLAEC